MLVLPQNLGSLTLHRKIGTGTVAESYLATGADGKPAVVRRILPFIVKDPSRKAGIEARVAELSGFRHPALVHVNGVVEAGGETFIVEEYVDGVSLERLITSARNQGVYLPPNLFLHIAVQICNALEALHSRPGATGAESVLHLGIKPGAVFVAQDGKVAVGSFGLTRSPNSLPHGGVAGPVAIKMEYLSPEQTHSDQQITPASDLFSLGAVLYELLTLESLFRAESNLQTIHRIRRGEVTSQLLRVKGKMPGLDKILYRALSVNPKHRYQRAFVLREDLRGLMSGYSFAAVTDDARAWLAPLFDERARAVDITTASIEESARSLESEESVTGIRPMPVESPTLEPVAARTLEPLLDGEGRQPARTLEPEASGAGAGAPRATITRTLVGLDDYMDAGGAPEATDLGFFPAQDPRVLPDPTASSAGAEPARPELGLAALRTSMRPVSLVRLDDEDAEPEFVRAGTLLPESETPESTAAWIARSAGSDGLGHDLPRFADGVENTAAHIGRGEPEDTASFIPAARHEDTASFAPDPRGSENTASFIPPRESTASGLPPADDREENTLGTGEVEPDPAPAFFPREAPAPVASAPPAPPAGLSRPMPGPGAARPTRGATAPPPAVPRPPAAPPPLAPAYEPEDAPAPPAPRAPLFLFSVIGGLAAIALCSGVVYGVSQYAVQARAERVAEALKDAAPPVVAASDDPASTLAEGLAPVDAMAPAPDAAPSVADASPPVPAAVPSVSAPPAEPAARPSEPAARPPEPVARVTEPAPSPRPGPVARPVEPVARPAPTPGPRPEPVVYEPPVRPTARPAPVAQAVLPVIEDPVDASLSTVATTVDIDAYATDARAGRLNADGADALASVPAGDANYSRAQTLLLSNALRKGDSSATERALKNLFAVPENTYNPQILAADALFQVNKGQYDRALARAQSAERYWSRLPPSQSFATRTQIYEVEAAAWQGKFYGSDGDLAALENAIRGWEKYRTHVASESRTDLEKVATSQIAKLNDIRERMQ